MTGRLVLAVLLAVLASGQEKTSPFTIAVLRRDGLVSPFAAFDRRWRTPWPQTVLTHDLPISLADIPRRWWGLDAPPEKMVLWRDGQRAGQVTLTAPVMARLMCQPRLALRSDFTPAGPLPPPIERPYPKEGLLVSSDVAVEPIASVEKGSAEWNATVIRLTKDFNEAETDATQVFTNWRHPVKEDRRKLVPITVETMYRAGTDDPEWTAYYVEAVRQYPPGREDKDGCGPLTFASGWVLVGPRDASRVRLSAHVTYCDRYGVNYMLPFGVITANDRKYWVYQFAGFDYELYEVARPTRRGIESQVVYQAGGCAP